MSWKVAALVALGAAGAAPFFLRAPRSASGLPPSTLAVWSEGGWREWWRSAGAPIRWAGPDPVVLSALQWRPAAPGLEWAELRLRGRGEAWRVRVIVARLDPPRLRFRLDTAYTPDRERPAWSVETAWPDPVFAINAGQFAHSRPWGWVVLDGREYLAPGDGPLSAAVAFDTAGAVHWVPGDALAEVRRRRGWAAAFQSYPVVLAGDGEVPEPLRTPGLGVDLAHRDARLAIGRARDGRLIAALTRFDGAGGVLDFVPFGLTTPEMAAVMGALGAREAVMLDGGISSQMLIWTRDGVRRWPGLRRVPLGLLAFPR